MEGKVFPLLFYQHVPVPKKITALVLAGLVSMNRMHDAWSLAVFLRTQVLFILFMLKKTCADSSISYRSYTQSNHLLYSVVFLKTEVIVVQQLQIFI